MKNLSSVATKKLWNAGLRNGPDMIALKILGKEQVSIIGNLLVFGFLSVEGIM